MDHESPLRYGGLVSANLTLRTPIQPAYEKILYEKFAAKAQYSDFVHFSYGAGLFYDRPGDVFFERKDGAVQRQ
jgi:hypothetical protein